MMARAELLIQFTHPGFLDLGIVAYDRGVLVYRFVFVRLTANQPTEKALQVLRAAHRRVENKSHYSHVSDDQPFPSPFRVAREA
jgi:hypothetical protein